jgi:hypothetical protein
MTIRNQSQHDAAQPRETETPSATPAKKPFVEPVIASPVDVLEATTFFQVVDSGGTGGVNRRRSTD